MAVSFLRRAYIRWHFFQLSFRAEEEQVQSSKAVFDTLDSQEIHYLAFIHNWDDGPIILRWIIESPKCDMGTAIMIFWLAEPDYYFKYQSRPVEGEDFDIWDLLQSILQRIKAKNFKVAKERFIPKEVGHIVYHSLATGIWELPPIVYDGTLGE